MLIVALAQDVVKALRRFDSTLQAKGFEVIPKVSGQLRSCAQHGMRPAFTNQAL
jgi:hypothetical protein